MARPRAKGAKAKTPSGQLRQATRKKAVPVAPPAKPKEEAAVATAKPVVSPSIGLSDIGRLAKSAIGRMLALVTPKSKGRKPTAAIKPEKAATSRPTGGKGAASKPT